MADLTMKEMLENIRISKEIIDESEKEMLEMSDWNILDVKSSKLKIAHDAYKVWKTNLIIYFFKLTKKIPFFKKN